MIFPRLLVVPVESVILEVISTKPAKDILVLVVVILAPIELVPEPFWVNPPVAVIAAADVPGGEPAGVVVKVPRRLILTDPLTYTASLKVTFAASLTVIFPSL
jgi:hypothetical protein